MATLKELIEKHGFNVWLAHVDAPKIKYFKPLAYCEFDPDSIIGEPNYKIVYDHFYNKDETFLIPFELPKKKVMLYPALYRYSSGTYYIGDALFGTELQASRYNYAGTFVRWLNEPRFGVEVEV
jgi:hypothetical protein